MKNWIILNFIIMKIYHWHFNMHCCAVISRWHRPPRNAKRRANIHKVFCDPVSYTYNVLMVSLSLCGACEQSSSYYSNPLDFSIYEVAMVVLVSLNSRLPVYIFGTSDTSGKRRAVAVYGSSIRRCPLHKFIFTIQNF